MPQTHEHYMQLALDLALNGRGKVEPNPMVGAVVVRDGKVVGQGYHECFGQAHAEPNAIADAGEACKGADLYVTLEPCTGLNKKTPPCCDAVIRAGFGRVFIGARDTTQEPAVAKLEDAGIEVQAGILEADCLELIAPFLKLQRTGRPWVIAKWAMTADGKIATSAGDSKWISCDQSRDLVHKWRSEIDAILVGAGTARHDDPLLTCRIPGGRNPLRIVLDSQATLSTESQLAQTVKDAPVLIVCHESAPSENIDRLAALGVRVLPLPGSDAHPDLGVMLDALGAEKVTNLLVEGGSQILGAFFDGQYVDELRIFIAPHIAGGNTATTPIGGQGLAAMADAAKLRNVTWEQIDKDMLLRGSLSDPKSFTSQQTM
jgi:diaminohydroxyphosphoribosylaminopyrimidine deaminase / 5-amino-6-(5-phosphoribosylamino)uracil reductase